MYIVLDNEHITLNQIKLREKLRTEVYRVKKLFIIKNQSQALMV